MKTLHFSFLSVLFIILLSGACSNPEKPVADKIRERVLIEFDTLNQLLEHGLIPAVTSTTSSSDSLRFYFLASRIQYKKIEHIAEYYLAGTARFINGPPLDELETEENRSFEPQGFQVLEELLFSSDSIDHAEAVRHARILLVNINRLKGSWENNVPTEAQLFDACRIQVFRILSLGLSGFDAPILKNSIAEAASSLHGLKETLAVLENQTNTNTFQKLWKDLERAEQYLLNHNDFNSFDRALFITRFANPLSRHLAEVRNQLGILPVKEARLLRADAITFFDEGAFRADYFSSVVDGEISKEKIELGRALFFDPVLSENNNRSCGSCHRPEKAFTDGLTKSLSLTGQPILRNTPTLINAAFQNAQFYDMRSNTLETQARDVVENKDEMHGSLIVAIDRLTKNSEYKSLFAKAFNRDTITTEQVQFAIASYIRSLSALNSPFDQYMRGDSTKLSTEQLEGFNLFMGKAQCGICHFMPLFNGTVPPSFTETESEVIGVPSKVEWVNATIDADPGRFGISKMDQLKFAFKTPTLRNAALTAPYMHNGVYTTLEQVMQFYNQGGGAGIGIDLPNQTLPADSLGLTTDEQAKVIAFVRVLTDTTGMTVVPKSIKSTKLLSQKK